MKKIGQLAPPDKGHHFHHPVKLYRKALQARALTYEPVVHSAPHIPGNRGGGRDTGRQDRGCPREVLLLRRIILAPLPPGFAGPLLAVVVVTGQPLWRSTAGQPVHAPGRVRVWGTEFVYEFARICARICASWQVGTVRYKCKPKQLGGAKPGFWCIFTAKRMHILVLTLGYYQPVNFDSKMRTGGDFTFHHREDKWSTTWGQEVPSE